MPPTPPPAADDDGPPGWQAHGRPVPHPRRAADSAAFFSDTGENPEVTPPSDAPLPPYMAQLFDHPGAGRQADAGNPWAPPPGHGDGFYDYDEEYETERFGDPREQRAAVVDLAGWSRLNPANAHPNVSGAMPVQRPDAAPDPGPSLDFGTGQPEATQAIDLGDVPRGGGAAGSPPAPKAGAEGAPEFSPLSAGEPAAETPPGPPAGPTEGGRPLGGLQPITPGLRPAARPATPAPGATDRAVQQDGTFAPLAPAGGGAPTPPNPWSGRPYVPQVPSIPDSARSPWAPFGGAAPVTEPGAEAGGPEATEVISWPFAPRTAPDDDPGPDATAAFAATEVVPAQPVSTTGADVPVQNRGAGTSPADADTAGGGPKALSGPDADTRRPAGAGLEALPGGETTAGHETALGHEAAGTGTGQAARGGDRAGAADTGSAPARTPARTWGPIPSPGSATGATASTEGPPTAGFGGGRAASARSSASEPPTAPITPAEAAARLDHPVPEPGTAADETVDAKHSVPDDAARRADPAGAHPAPVWVATTRWQPVDLPAGRDGRTNRPDPLDTTTPWNARTDEQPIIDAGTGGQAGAVADRPADATAQRSPGDGPAALPHSARPRRRTGDGPMPHPAAGGENETPVEVIEAIMEALRERTGEQVPVSETAAGPDDTAPSAEPIADVPGTKAEAAGGVPRVEAETGRAKADVPAAGSADTAKHDDLPLASVDVEAAAPAGVAGPDDLPPASADVRAVTSAGAARRDDLPTASADVSAATSARAAEPDDPPPAFGGVPAGHETGSSSHTASPAAVTPANEDPLSATADVSVVASGHDGQSPTPTGITATAPGRADRPTMPVGDPGTASGDEDRSVSLTGVQAASPRHEDHSPVRTDAAGRADRTHTGEPTTGLPHDDQSLTPSDARAMAPRHGERPGTPTGASPEAETGTTAAGGRAAEAQNADSATADAGGAGVMSASAGIARDDSSTSGAADDSGSDRRAGAAGLVDETARPGGAVGREPAESVQASSPLDDDGAAAGNGTPRVDADAAARQAVTPDEEPGEPRETSDDADDPGTPDLAAGTRNGDRDASGAHRAGDRPVPDGPAVQSDPGLSVERSAEIGAAVAALRSGARKAGSIVYTPASGGRRRAPVPEHADKQEPTPTAEAETPADGTATTGAAATTDHPAATGTAVTTDRPATTGTAAATDHPATTGTAVTTDHPATTGTAAATDHPATTGTAAATDHPATTGTAATTDHPATADQPATTGTASSAGHPADGTVPTDHAAIGTAAVDRNPADDTAESDRAAGPEGTAGREHTAVPEEIAAPDDAASPSSASGTSDGDDQSATAGHGDAPSHGKVTGHGKVADHGDAASLSENASHGKATGHGETASHGDAAGLGRAAPLDDIAAETGTRRVHEDGDDDRGLSSVAGEIASPESDTVDRARTDRDAGRPDDDVPDLPVAAADAGPERKGWARTPAEEPEWTAAPAAPEADEGGSRRTVGAGLSGVASAGVAHDAGRAGAEDGPPHPKPSGMPEDRATVTNAPERDDEDDDVTVLSTKPDHDHDHEDDGPQLRPGDVVETPIAVWTDEAAAPFRQQWHEIKAQFVDDPVGALAQAQTVCANAVHDLADALLAEQAGLDPHKTNATPDTESMRIAMRRYREFLDRVLAL